MLVPLSMLLFGPLNSHETRILQKS